MAVIDNVDEAVSALASAWRMTVTATFLLLAALVLAPYWDLATYLKALQAALTSDPI